MSTETQQSAQSAREAIAIYEGAVRVWAAIPRANVFSVTDLVSDAAEILRAAEAEVRKGGGK